MFLISKLKALITKEKPPSLEEYTPPFGYRALGGQCPYSGYYINDEGIIFNKKTNTFHKQHRYIRLFGIYHYVPRLVLETFNKTIVDNIHSIEFRDNDRDNWSHLNMYLVDHEYSSYYIHNDYTHELTLNGAGSAKEDEYVIYTKDLLDHNWTKLYRQWINTHPQDKRLKILELIVDIQHKTLQFRAGRRGVPLAQPIRGKLIYNVICDNESRDFWIVPPKKKSNFRDLVRMDTQFKLVKE